MVKAFTPREALDNKVIPDFVIEAVNTLLSGKITNTPKGSIVLKQSDIIKEIFFPWKLSTENLDLDTEAGMSIMKEEISKHGWLNFESIYRDQGWTVKYDKPGFNESREASFIFEYTL